MVSIQKRVIFCGARKVLCIYCHYKNLCLFVPTGQGMVEMWSSIPYNASLVDAVDMVVSPRHEKHVKVRGGN